MDKRYARIYVVNGDKVVAQVRNMPELHDKIDGIIANLPENDFSNLRAFNVLDVLPLSDLITYTPGDINIGDEEDASFGDCEYEYRIVSGKCRGESFDDIDDLTQYLCNAVRDGKMTIEEVQELTIEKKSVEELTFSGAWEDDGTFSIVIERLYEFPELRDTYERMGIEFEPSHEVTKAALAYEFSMTPEQVEEHVDKKINEYIENFDIVSLNKPVEELDDSALQFQIIKMLRRVNELQQEQQRRNALR